MVHVVLAVFLAVLFISIVMICRAVFENIVSRHTAFRKIELIAQRDPLTDLLNRSAFIDLLQSRLESIAKTGETVALVLIDLDRFKDVNDTFGHQTGDVVLKKVGDRIKVGRAAEGRSCANWRRRIHRHAVGHERRRNHVGDAQRFSRNSAIPSRSE